MPEGARRILMLDCTASLGTTIGFFGKEAGWSVEEASLLDKQYRHKYCNYSLLLIDASQLSAGGFLQCAAVIRKARNTPVIIITSEGNADDRLKAFQAGADDSISKPFSSRELLYRIRGILNRISRPNAAENTPFPNKLLHKTVELAPHSPFIRVDRYSIRLSFCEYKLMRYLSEHCNQTVTRKELLEGVWKSNQVGYNRTVDVNIRRIRGKLRQINPELVGLIHTVRGLGYCFINPAAETV
ncbi:response regulator transcription factor [Paenibacillus pasadenensis]|uniref:response regulator transcription factor n=1 Tax=Paenibacillus pasadenensis TaxID=217090 RepID=UPI00203EB310|nr:response regulator transcription factor [Paenibacillus pasadenensis]MCM3747971.1 response regulator transcription factor [Paenibacillus pasadenensis]